MSFHCGVCSNSSFESLPDGRIVCADCGARCSEGITMTHPVNPWQEPSEPLHRYSYAIVDVCAAIHGSYSGSGDPMAPEQLARLIAWLEDRLGNWYPSQFSDIEAYDKAIRELATAALNEARLDLKRSQEPAVVTGGAK